MRQPCGFVPRISALIRGFYFCHSTALSFIPICEKDIHKRRYGEDGRCHLECAYVRMTGACSDDCFCTDSWCFHYPSEKYAGRSCRDAGVERGELVLRGLAGRPENPLAAPDDLGGRQPSLQHAGHGHPPLRAGPDVRRERGHFRQAARRRRLRVFGRAWPRRHQLRQRLFLRLRQAALHQAGVHRRHDLHDPHQPRQDARATRSWG